MAKSHQGDPGSSVQVRQQRAPQTGADVAGRQAERSATVAAATAARQPPAPLARVGSARPSTEKEGAVLREALLRRQESQRRLDGVRADARARLAALKAETEARRAAKLAAGRKAQDDAAATAAAKKAPPPLPPRGAGAGAGAGTTPAVGLFATAPPAVEGARTGSLGSAPGGGALGLSLGPPPSPREDGRAGTTVVEAVAAARRARPAPKRRQFPHLRAGRGEGRGGTGEGGEGEQEKEKEKASASGVEVPLSKAAAAHLKDAEGFKALWRETAQVRQAEGRSAGGGSGGGGGGEAEAGTRAKEVVLGENGAPPSVHESASNGNGTADAGEHRIRGGAGDGGKGGDGDSGNDRAQEGEEEEGAGDGEERAGWEEVDLLGKEAGEEVGLIITINVRVSWILWPICASECVACRGACWLQSFNPLKAMVVLLWRRQSHPPSHTVRATIVLFA